MEAISKQELTTAHLADGCLRANVATRCLAMKSVVPGARIEGPAFVVRHYGSVDVFLEAFEQAPPGSVLVVDNEQREDEACIGDLVAIEAMLAGLAGIVIWGFHRDSREIRALNFPVFSLGSIATGPERLDPRDGREFSEIYIGGFAVGRTDYVVADEDGVLFIPLDRRDDVYAAAAGIAAKEREQARLARSGVSIRKQLRLDEYIASRSANPALTFRAHLHCLGGSIEEPFGV